MKRNFRDVETIVILAGVYDWNDDGKILITRKDKVFEVNGFKFASIKAACDFTESYPKNDILSKSARAAADFAKVAARDGVKLTSTVLRWAGRKLDSCGAAIKESLDK